jgi:hypothetical protein
VGSLISYETLYFYQRRWVRIWEILEDAFDLVDIEQDLGIGWNKGAQSQPGCLY